MSTSYASERPSGADAPAPAATAWVSMVVFSGILLLTLGVLQMAEGGTALYNESFYLVTSDGSLLRLDYQVWGWLHLVLGLITLATGAGLLLGWFWARVTGVLITFLGALLHFVFLAAAPLWCSILLGMDILIIYALCAHGGEVRRRRLG